MYMEQMTEGLPFIDVINSTSNNNTNTNSIGVDMSKVKRVRYFITPTNVGVGGLIDGRLQSSPNANFNVVHNISGTNFTELNTNNVSTSVEVRADQVTQANAGDRYVRLQFTGSVVAVTAIAWALGGDTEQKPGSQYNLNTTFFVAGTVCNI